MLGFGIVLLACIFFCFQNVIVRVLFNPYNLFEALPTGGFVEPTLGNSFLLLWMRMLVGVPLLALLSPILYRFTWSEIASLQQTHRRPERYLALWGGGLMFLYLALLYLSIGQIPTGIALTLFFTFPVFTALFSWAWFGARPSGFRWILMGFILLGSALSAPYAGGMHGSSWLGVITGLGAGVAYALYTVVAQKSFETLHPVPFTWISFAVTLLLALIFQGFWQEDLSGLPWRALWIGSAFSAGATFAGHVLNNLGIRMIGATAAAMIGAANPALTTLLAWGAISEHLSWRQGSGVALVTLCVALLGREQRPGHSLHSDESTADSR